MEPTWLPLQRPICPRRSLLGHELFPGAPQGELKPDQGGDEDIELAGFHLLQVPGADVGKFREGLLRLLPGASFPADVGAQHFEPNSFFSI